MAISYEQMPERFQREAIQIFADQLNGKISNTEAEQKARANEAAAQQAVAAGATGGSFLTTPPASTGGGPGTSRPGGTATVKRDCPVGYIWDEERQECVPDPNKGIGLPSIETETDPMEDPTRKPSGAPTGFWVGSIKGSFRPVSSSTGIVVFVSSTTHD